MATIFFPPVGFKKFLMTYHNFDYKILKLFLIHEPIDFLILTAYLDFGAVESGSQTIRSRNHRPASGTYVGRTAGYAEPAGSWAGQGRAGQGSCGPALRTCRFVGRAAAAAGDSTGLFLELLRWS